MKAGFVRRWRRRGFTLTLTVFMMFFVMGAVGLAIDAGVLYVVRGRLSAAVDSAALAAGRGVNLGTDLTSAQSQATASARRFFDANFPPGYLGTDPAGATVTATFQLQLDQFNNPNGVLVVTVNGQVNAPVYFMRLFGKTGVPVTATGTATRRNLVLVMVLDKSSSMGSRQSSVGTLPTTIPSNATSCEAMVIAAGQFVDYFSPYDNVGMVQFDASASIAYPASTSFKNAGSTGVKNSIANINCGSNTNTTAALEAAYSEVLRIGQRLALNVIVLFTDGVPNGVNANFPLRTQVDTRLGPAKNVSSTNPADTPAGNRANCLDTSGTKTCVNMPVVCTTGTVRGAITQTSGFAINSGSRDGLFKSFNTDTAASFPSGCPSSGTNMTSQSLAYIPDTDRFGNSTHGPKDGWVFQVNQQCAPSGTQITTGNSACKNLGGQWSSYPTGAGSNFFTSGPYLGKFRPDLSNTIGVTSMNTAINEAAKIRTDANYSIRIDTIYLQGNGGDPVDRDFLPIVANVQQIPPLIYESLGTPDKPNPYFDQNQQTGMYLQSANAVELTRLFSEIASSLLRISN